MSRVLHVDRDAPDPAAIADAAAVLRAGGLVAFPTETVYGLGAHALDPQAVARIFAAKGRPAFNPLIAHVHDVDAARALVADWPDIAARLAAAFWPGPLTLVLPRRAHVPDLVTAGLDRVAVRIPAHPVALALLRAAGLPVAAPSANRFTELSPTTAAHVLKALGDRVDLVLDGGPTSVGIESAVVDCSDGDPVLLRPGALDPARIAAVAGRPLGAPAPLSAPDAPRSSPGMVERHYAPRATLHLLAPRDRAPERAQARALVAEARATGARTGALLLAPDPTLAVDDTVLMPREPAGYARALYAALHDMDDAGCALVLVEAVPDERAWDGVRDRLSRATK